MSPSGPERTGKGLPSGGLDLCRSPSSKNGRALILDDIDLKMDAMRFYRDSKLVLGYIYKEVKSKVE